MHYQIWGNNVRHGIQFYKVSFCASDTNVVGNLYIETVIPVIVMSSAVHYAALSLTEGVVCHCHLNFVMMCRTVPHKAELNLITMANHTQTTTSSSTAHQLYPCDTPI